MKSRPLRHLGRQARRLPAADAPRARRRRALQRRQVEPDQRARRPGRPRAHVAHAGPHAPRQLVRDRRPAAVPPRRSARLRLRRGQPGHARELAPADRDLPRRSARRSPACCCSIDIRRGAAGRGARLRAVARRSARRRSSSRSPRPTSSPKNKRMLEVDAGQAAPRAAQASPIDRLDAVRRGHRSAVARAPARRRAEAAVQARAVIEPATAGRPRRDRRDRAPLVPAAVAARDVRGRAVPRARAPRRRAHRAHRARPIIGVLQLLVVVGRGAHPRDRHAPGSPARRHRRPRCSRTRSPRPPPSAARCATLEVRRGNAPAIALYERAGFRGVHVRARYYQDNDEDALVMLLDLSAPSALSALTAPRR